MKRTVKTFDHLGWKVTIKVDQSNQFTWSAKYRVPSMVMTAIEPLTDLSLAEEEAKKMLTMITFYNERN